MLGTRLNRFAVGSWKVKKTRRGRIKDIVPLVS
jgi:hypothetical protein